MNIWKLFGSIFLAHDQAYIIVKALVDDTKDKSWIFLINAYISGFIYIHGRCLNIHIHI